MYRFERLLNNARQLRIVRAQRARSEIPAGDLDWQKEWLAARRLILDLAGLVGERSDRRCVGSDDILDLAPLNAFIERGALALRALADEMGLEVALVSAAESRIRRRLSEASEDRAIGKAVPKAPETEEQRAQRRKDFADRFVKTKASSLSDVAALAIESALLDVVEQFRVEGDRRRELIAIPERAGVLEIVNGQVRRKRKPRTKKAA